MHNDKTPLTREEVCSVIAGRARTRRVPMFIHFWVHSDEFGDRRQAVLDLLDQYPCDIQAGHFHMPTTYRDDNPKHPDHGRQRNQRRLHACQPGSIP